MAVLKTAFETQTKPGGASVHLSRPRCFIYLSITLRKVGPWTHLFYYTAGEREREGLLLLLEEVTQEKWLLQDLTQSKSLTPEVTAWLGVGTALQFPVEPAVDSSLLWWITFRLGDGQYSKKEAKPHLLRSVFAIKCKTESFHRETLLPDSCRSEQLLSACVTQSIVRLLNLVNCCSY